MPGRAGGAVGVGWVVGGAVGSGAAGAAVWLGGLLTGYGRELRSVPQVVGVAVRCHAVQLVADMVVLLRVVDMAGRS